MAGRTTAPIPVPVPKWAKDTKGQDLDPRTVEQMRVYSHETNAAIGRFLALGWYFGKDGLLVEPAEPVTPFAGYLEALKKERLPATISILAANRRSVLRAIVRDGEVVDLVRLEVAQLRASPKGESYVGVHWTALVDSSGHYGFVERSYTHVDGALAESAKAEEAMGLSELAEHYKEGDVLDPETMRAAQRRRQLYVAAEQRREACLDFVACRLSALYSETLQVLGLTDERVESWRNSEDARVADLSEEQARRALLVRAFLEGYDPLSETVVRGAIPSNEQSTWELWPDDSDAKIVDRLLLAFRAAWARYE
jgi:hypothetical protein